MAQEKDKKQKSIIETMFSNDDKNKVHQKYDKILKELLDNPILMKQLIKGFVNKKWVNEIDFNTLKKEPTNFLSDDLKEFRKDLLWSVKLKDKIENEKIYFYIHIEFQSAPDRKMPFRFLIYDSLLHLDILKNREGIEKKKKLPFIFPILFYIGDIKWNFDLNLTKLIQQPFEDSINYIPKFEIFKIMLNDKSLEELININSLLSNILASDNKNITKESLDKVTEKIMNILSGFDSNKEKMMRDKVNKFFKLITSERIDVSSAINELNKEDRMGGLMNLINKEREEGIQEGIEKGIEKGIKKEKLELVQKMLKANIDISQISEISGLSLEEIKELQ